MTRTEMLETCVAVDPGNRVALHRLTDHRTGKKKIDKHSVDILERLIAYSLNEWERILAGIPEEELEGFVRDYRQARLEEETTRP